MIVHGKELQKMSKYSYYNIPKEMNKREYGSSRHKILEKYKGMKGLEAIYEWGSVEHPGISDIDIVFVFKDKVKPLAFSQRSFQLMDTKTRYLARHPFVFIDKKSFQQIPYVYKNTNFHLLKGSDIGREKLTAKEKREVQLATLNEITIRHYPRDFLSQEVHKKINVRDTLLRLNSLQHSVKTLEELKGKKITKYNAFLKKVKLLREEWFENGRYNAVAAANKEAVDLCLTLMNEFIQFIKREREIVAKGKIKYKGIKNRAVFVENWDKDIALKKMTASEKKKNYKSILPIELAPQLYEYAKQKGPISDYIRKNLSGDIQYTVKHQETLKKRITILNNQAMLAYKLRHSDFAAFFDFGYRNTSGVNNWLLNTWDKIRK